MKKIFKNKFFIPSLTGTGGIPVNLISLLIIYFISLGGGNEARPLHLEQWRNG